MTEKELLQEYVIARESFEALEEETKKAKERLDKAQAILIDDLQSRQASKTARYDGLGCLSLNKPIVGARALSEEQLFDYLTKIDRKDLLKTTCHHKTLSSFVGEMLETGKEIPGFIEYWFKSSVRLTK